MNNSLSQLAELLFEPRHRLLASSDVEEVVDGCTRALRPHRLAMQRKRSALATSLFHLPIGAFSINRLRYGCDVEVAPAVPDEDNFLITLPLTGAARFSYQSESADIIPGCGAIVGPYHKFRFEIGGDFDQIIVRLNRSRVERICAALLGRNGLAPVHFDLAMRDIPAFWLGLLESAAHLSRTHNNPGHPQVLAHFEELIIESLLLSQPSRCSTDIAGAARRVWPPRIGRAMAYMQEHLDEPLRLHEVALACGMSLRSLQDGFQRHVGISPRSWLRSQRLDRVHAVLASAEPGATTVTEAALQWGFFHLGEFAAHYQRRFGEKPSQTLARRRQ